MREEDVTKTILLWLRNNGWEILSYDFPQSGTGTLLHPNNSSDKNLGTIIPDIVCVKGDIAVFFENKNRCCIGDYRKVHNLISENHYTEAIKKIFGGKQISQIFYGIGLPTSAHQKSSKDNMTLVDFIIGVNDNNSVSVLFNPHAILW